MYRFKKKEQSFDGFGKTANISYSQRKLIAKSSKRFKGFITL